jgi:hypothetical protein
VTRADWFSLAMLAAVALLIAFACAAIPPAGVS